MKFLATTFSVIIVYAFCNGSQAQESSSNPIQLNIASQNVSHGYEMSLSVRIISKWQKPIAVPRDLSWGQLTAPNFAFLYIELQRKVGGKYKEVSLNATLDNFGSVEVDSLYQGDSVASSDFSMAGLTKYPIGDYRVRVLCRLSAFNPGMKNIYSNWVYFRCVKDIKLHDFVAFILADNRLQPTNPRR
jgi:hypothetical protein